MLSFFQILNICLEEEHDTQKRKNLVALRCHSVQFSRLVVSDSFQPHESQHARPPCPSPIPGVHSDSRPSSQWCHPANSSSVIPFSSCPQSLPASVFSNESTLHMKWPKYWPLARVSALASFLPKKSQGWFPTNSPRIVHCLEYEDYLLLFTFVPSTVPIIQ